MKKTVALLLLIVCLCGLSGCHTFDNAKIDRGESAIYTEKEVEAALRVVKNQFRLWSLRGYEVHRIAYGGDEECNEKNLAWLNRLNASSGAKKPFTQCIMFVSEFHTADEYRGDGLTEDMEYTGWQWWLARTDGGRWKIVTYGCA
ncbi:MAG: hypothetical protein IJK89_11700 [Clostridia bacterium]|nr:hypothetical protein [Clostridia bacterium]